MPTTAMLEPLDEREGILLRPNGEPITIERMVLKIVEVGGPNPLLTRVMEQAPEGMDAFYVGDGIPVNLAHRPEEMPLIYPVAFIKYKT